jgi:hypothetical protein
LVHIRADHPAPNQEGHDDARYLAEGLNQHHSSGANIRIHGRANVAAELNTVSRWSVSHAPACSGTKPERVSRSTKLDHMDKTSNASTLIVIRVQTHGNFKAQSDLLHDYATGSPQAGYGQEGSQSRSTKPLHHKTPPAWDWDNQAPPQGPIQDSVTPKREAAI